MFQSNLLTLEGYVRGRPLQSEALIHIPGSENFQIESISVLVDPFHRIVNEKEAPRVEIEKFIPDPEIMESLDPLQASTFSEEDMKVRKGLITLYSHFEI